MQSEVTIEKNIPVPPKLKGKAAEVAVILGSMDVGDSFVFDDVPNKNEQHRIQYVAKKLGIRTTIRLIGTGQYRAWRTA